MARTLKAQVNKAARQARQVECRLCHQFYERGRGIKNHLHTCRRDQAAKKLQELRAQSISDAQSRLDFESPSATTHFRSDVNSGGKQLSHGTPQLSEQPVTNPATAPSPQFNITSSPSLDHPPMEMSGQKDDRDIADAFMKMSFGSKSDERTSDQMVEDHIANENQDESHPNEQSQPLPSDSPPRVKIEYHPRSGRNTEILSLDEYITRADSEIDSLGFPDEEDRGDTDPSQHSAARPLKAPWYPFKTQADFDFAECVSSLRLSNQEIDDLLRRHTQVWTRNSETNISFKSHRDITQVWEHHRSSIIPFEPRTVRASYLSHTGEKVHEEYQVHVRNLMDCVRNLLQDKKLAANINWYPVKKYLVNAGETTQFWDDLECGDDWWGIQDALPNDETFVPLILYSDATVISRFNGRSYHPVILRLGSVPARLRNTLGYAGGTLVGYMPEIITPKLEKHSPHFKNFKRSVVHGTFKEITSGIRSASIIGEAIHCGDGVDRVLRPGVYILSADHEEQSYLALTRGTNALYPCSICLVPKHAQTQLQLYPARTVTDSKTVVHTARKLLKVHGQKTIAQEMLKSRSLRVVDNAFWKLGLSDPYKALSFDKLHVFSGLYKHIADAVFSLLSCGFSDQHMLTIIDDRFSDMLPWNGHRWLPEVTQMTFADANRWYSMFHRVIPCLVDLIPDVMHGEEPVNMSSPLRLMHLVAELSEVLSIEFVTTKHVALAESLAQVISQVIPDASAVLSKDFNFPKMHVLLAHATAHLTRKAATKHYSTTLGESGHAGLKLDFAATNGRGAEIQIARMHELRPVMNKIRQSINDSLSLSSGHGSGTGPNSTVMSFPSLSSKQRRSHITSYELRRRGRAYFKQMLPNLCKWMTYHLRQKNLMGSQDRLTQLSNHGMITPFRAVKIQYRSFSSQRLVTETLRCTDSFHKRERYDTCLVKLSDGTHTIARLHLLFSCEAYGKVWNVALVTLFKTVAKPETTSIGMRLLREDRDGSFIDIDWIVRSVFLCPAFEPSFPHDFWLNDLVDSIGEHDIYLRLRETEIEH